MVVAFDLEELPVLIKAAADKQPQLDVLKALLVRPHLRSAMRSRIEEDIRTTAAGWKGEHDAAYEIEFHFGRTRNYATIHDLRIEVEGFVVQVDHMVISRLLQIWVCESKSFSQGVSINDYSEWSTRYNGRNLGIPSPVEQNRRHLVALRRLFVTNVCPVPRRFGRRIVPDLDGLVLISNHAFIRRPKVAVDGIETVIKVERLKATVEAQFDDRPQSLLRVVSESELERFARNLAALHRPASVDVPARYGLTPPPNQQAPTPPRPGKRGPLCVSCARVLTSPEAWFCRFNKARFGGRFYCIDCQQSVPATAPTGERGA